LASTLFGVAEKAADLIKAAQQLFGWTQFHELCILL
jgi:hypothetical protein